MRPLWNTCDGPARIHPALNSFAGECCGMLARLTAYVGVLALLAMAGLHLWDQLLLDAAERPAAQEGWSLATRTSPAFAATRFDSSVKTEVYEIFRHPEGGRKDVFHWAALGEKPVAELEIYRPGGEGRPSRSAIDELAARIDRYDLRAQEKAGIIDSKFGAVTLLRLAGKTDETQSCLGYVGLDAPDLRISGWSCLGDTLPARRAMIGCMLSHLVLLTAGHEPKLAELFARAELVRGTCTPSAASADWITEVQNPRLRGTL